MRNGVAAGCRVGVVNGMEPQLGVEWNGTAAGCRMGVGVVQLGAECVGVESQLGAGWNRTAAGCRIILQLVAE